MDENAVVTMMMERHREIKTLSFRGDIEDFRCDHPLVQFVNIKYTERHLVLLLSFDTIKGRHKAGKHL